MQEPCSHEAADKKKLLSGEVPGRVFYKYPGPGIRGLEKEPLGSGSGHWTDAEPQTGIWNS